MVCMAVYYERKLQNLFNFFLVSLALCDLLLSVLVMPLGVLVNYMGENLKRKKERKK